MKKKKNKEIIHLSKFLATAGIASRRKVVEEIKNGHVAINGTTIKEPAQIIKKGDLVTYKGRPVEQAEKVYILLNKPNGYITSTADERGRKTVMDLIQVDASRLFPVGRLDRNTTGLLLITNDGELSQKLAHPRYRTSKTYRATLDRSFSPRDLEQLKAGVNLIDGFIKPDHVFISPGSHRYDVVIELHSGKNHVVRRIFEHLGYDIKKLDRSHYAGLSKKNLPCGTWRFLTPYEIQKLKE